MGVALSALFPWCHLDAGPEMEPGAVESACSKHAIDEAPSCAPAGRATARGRPDCKQDCQVNMHMLHVLNLLSRLLGLVDGKDRSLDSVPRGGVAQQGGKIQTLKQGG